METLKIDDACRFPVLSYGTDTICSWSQPTNENTAHFYGLVTSTSCRHVQSAQYLLSNFVSNKRILPSTYDVNSRILRITCRHLSVSKQDNVSWCDLRVITEASNRYLHSRGMMRATKNSFI